MKGYKIHIEQATLSNQDYRHVLYTGHHTQLVLMTLLPGQEIGVEVHSENDQFFRFEEGEGKVIIDNTEYTVKDGDAVIVPSGAEHNVINTSQEHPLKLYTLYSPPHHQDQLVRMTKEDADTNGVDFDGKTTE